MQWSMFFARVIDLLRTAPMAVSDKFVKQVRIILLRIAASREDKGWVQASSQLICLQQEHCMI